MRLLRRRGADSTQTLEAATTSTPSHTRCSEARGWRHLARDGASKPSQTSQATVARRARVMRTSFGRGDIGSPHDLQRLSRLANIQLAATVLAIALRLANLLNFAERGWRVKRRTICFDLAEESAYVVVAIVVASTAGAELLACLADRQADCERTTAARAGGAHLAGANGAKGIVGAEGGIVARPAAHARLRQPKQALLSESWTLTERRLETATVPEWSRSKTGS